MTSSVLTVFSIVSLFSGLENLKDIAVAFEVEPR